MIGLIIFLILLITVAILYFIIAHKLKKTWKEFFGDKSIKEVMNEQQIETENTPKSLFGMETSYLGQIKKDFPDLNINEIKSIGENYIIKYLNAIEEKDKTKLDHVSDKMKSVIESKINDLKNKQVNYDNIKIHRTVLSRYEKKNGLATITLQTAFEYIYKENNKTKKIQDRYNTEFIYIIDSEKTKSKAIGLNCPNCGAPIKNLGEKYCNYCGSGIKDIVKRTWILNNIYQN